jgi:hypothetical protein
MRNNEIRYTSIALNLRVTEFRWKPYLSDPDLGGKIWVYIVEHTLCMAGVEVNRDHGGSASFVKLKITRNYVTFRFVFETGYYA